MNKFVLKAIITTLRIGLNTLSYFSKEKAGEEGFKIFSKPRKGKLTEENKSFLDTALKEGFAYNHLDIQTYFWKGDSEKKILLVHGWESNSARWKPLIQHLQNKKFTIIALDAPAHGASGSDYFDVILYAEMVNVVAQKFQPAIILGHSAGGYATSFFYNKYRPDFVKKMVLLSPVSDNRVIFNLFFNYLGTTKRVVDGFYAYFKKKYGDPENLVVSEFSKDFSVKALIIHDKKDDVVPFEQSEKINASWKNSELFLTENLGHSLRNEIVYKKVLDFIETNP